MLPFGDFFASSAISFQLETLYCHFRSASAEICRRAFSASFKAILQRCRA
jgi:hypothetical protein